MVHNLRAKRCLAGLLLVGLVGCSSGLPEQPVESDWQLDAEAGERPDADVDGDDGESTGDLTLELGGHGPSMADFEPYEEGAADFELIRGFQGGFHLEPVLYLEGVGREDFTAEIDYQVRRRSDGEMMNRQTTFEIGPRQWSAHEEGYLHFSNPVIFTSRRPDEIIGTPVELVVSVDLQGGGSVTVSDRGTVVDP